MFEGGMKEGSQAAIQIVNWQYDVFMNMLRFIYTGKISKHSQEDIIKLVAIADAYNLNDLKLVSEKMLTSFIDCTNVIDILKMAHKFSALSLKSLCLNYLCEHTKETEIKSLEEEPSLLLEFTNHVLHKDK
jgi:speckle-type POZ protein